MHARLVVLASGGGRTMENLQRRIEAGELHAQIVLVIVSSGDIGAAERAHNLGLTTLVIGPRSQPNREKREHLLVGAILEARADLVVLAGWLQLLPIPQALEGKVINIHPALLPAYGGQGFYGHHVHDAVVRDSPPVSGCTVHFASAEYDRGPIVLQSAVLLDGDEDADAVASKVFAAELEAYPEALQMLIDGRCWWEDDEVRFS